MLPGALSARRLPTDTVLLCPWRSLRARVEAIRACRNFTRPKWLTWRTALSPSKLKYSGIASCARPSQVCEVPTAAQRGSGSSNSEAWFTAASRRHQRKGKKSAILQRRWPAENSRPWAHRHIPLRLQGRRLPTRTRSNPCEDQRWWYKGKGRSGERSELQLRQLWKTLSSLSAMLIVTRKWSVSSQWSPSCKLPTPRVAKWWSVISGDESALDQPALS